MNPILFFVALGLFVPSIIALLALRYGSDSRPPYRSSEHLLALRGMRWEDDTPKRVAVRKPQLRLVSSDPASPYPTLAKIDSARGGEADPFVSHPQAAHLEARACQLVDAYWSDSVWLTGLVPVTAFRKVCDALDHERLAVTAPASLHPQAPGDTAATASVQAG